MEYTLTIIILAVIQMFINYVVISAKNLYIEELEEKVRKNFGQTPQITSNENEAYETITTGDGSFTTVTINGAEPPIQVKSQFLPVPTGGSGSENPTPRKSKSIAKKPRKKTPKKKP